VRLVTLHPLFSHFTIGGLPLIVIAYALAALGRSRAWTLVGDAALIVTALLTLVTTALGLVSNALVGWPGGLEGWQQAHLVLGIAATIALVIAAAVRVHRRGRSGWGALAGALVIGALVAAVGGIGCEVLVFHAGIGVRAAGDGALAPPVRDLHTRPHDFLDAMRQARAAWGSIEGRLARMLVRHPDDDGFARIVLDARRLRTVAEVMAEEGARDPKHADVLAAMSQTLAGQAAEIEEAAAKHDLAETARAHAEASALCADCHAQVRWR
jgi:hypothetical protein